MQANTKEDMAISLYAISIVARKLAKQVLNEKGEKHEKIQRIKRDTRRHAGYSG